MEEKTRPALVITWQPMPIR